jgi:glutamate synthase domain-containing protein 3
MESVAPRVASETVAFDLAQQTVRQLNQYLHDLPREVSAGKVLVTHPAGQHSIAAGVDAPVMIEIRGHTGYYLAGMNKQASIEVFGNVGWGVAENMMSGHVHVHGAASASAGASAHGGVLVIDGDAGSRCGISLKGADICVGGSVGHMSGFMAQAGRMLICGDAGVGLGDSLYEAVIYVRGEIKGLGVDARVEPLGEADYESIAELLKVAGFSYPADEFRRVASAKQLYHWNGSASHYH